MVWVNAMFVSTTDVLRKSSCVVGYVHMYNNACTHWGQTRAAT